MTEHLAQLKNMVSAWSVNTVWSWDKRRSKSNEITAIPALLEMLDISGCIVTIDAMGTHRLPRKLYGFLLVHFKLER